MLKRIVYNQFMLAETWTFQSNFQISFADYNIFDLLDNLQVLSPDSLHDFPLLKAFHTRIANHEKLLRYRQSDAFKNLPINGNGKQWSWFQTSTNRDALKTRPMISIISICSQQ